MLRNIRYGKGWNSFPSLVVLILMESNITISLIPGCFYLLVFGYCVVCEYGLIPQYTERKLCSVNNSSCLSWGYL